MAFASSYESPGAYVFKRQLFAAFLCSIFLFLSVLGVLNHEMFRDELQAWMIAANSPSLASMFRALRYEGHPGLWHLCLFAISRATRNPLAMQVFHICLSTVAIYLFARFSPFSRTQIALFSFSYFPLFEYNLISRNYSLGLIFLFLFCSLFPYRHRGYLCLSLCLAALANTNPYGLLLSLILAGILTVDGLVSQQLQMFVKNRLTMLAISALFFGIGIYTALVQIVPPEDASFQASEKIFAGESQFAIAGNLRHLLFSILRIESSYIPIPDVFQHSFWNTNILLESSGILKLVAFGLSIFLVLASVFVFSKSVPIWLGYSVGTAGMIYFIYDRFFGELRHHGHLFILFVVCAWLYAYTQPDHPRRTKAGTAPHQFQPRFSRIKLLSYLFTSLLIAQFVAGAYTYTMDIVRPFSASALAVNYIQENGLRDRVIIGHRASITSPIGALLNRPLYYPELGRLGTFIPWNDLKPVAGDDDVLAQTHQLLETEPAPVLLVLSEALTGQRADLRITPLESFAAEIVPYERYYLYSAEPR